MRNNFNARYANIGSLEELIFEKKQLEQKLKVGKERIYTGISEVYKDWSFIPQTARFISRIRDYVPKLLQITTLIFNLFLHHKRK